MENYWNYALNGNIKGLSKLLDKGININSRGDIGVRKNWTALMFASRFSNSTSSLDTVKLLLDRGADINLKEIDGWTALMLAARVSNTDSSLDTVRLLLDRGADVNLKEKDGWTALMLAVRYSNTVSSLDTVRLLLEHNADVNLKDNESCTVLMLASRYRYLNTDTVKLLLDRGADVNLKEKDGWSALMLAARYSNTESTFDTVRLLLERGADINLKNNNGWTALMLATRYSNTDSSIDTVKLLLEYGADPFDNITCPTNDCKKLIDEARWKRLYQRDKETAKRYSKNGEYYLPKEVWEIILLEKRRQQLCQNLSSDKNKEILKLFAIELGINITNKTTKAQLCGYISAQLVYGKEEKYKGVIINKLYKGANYLLTLARTFGINTDKPLSEVMSDLAKIYQ